MRITLAILVLLCLAATAAGQVITIVPQAPTPPAKIVVQPTLPITVYRPGPLGYALWPRTYWVPGPSTTYVPEHGTEEESPSVAEPPSVVPVPTARLGRRTISIHGPHIYIGP